MSASLSCKILPYKQVASIDLHLRQKFKGKNQCKIKMKNFWRFIMTLSIEMFVKSKFILI
jgi:hypothetical protein